MTAGHHARKYSIEKQHIFVCIKIHMYLNYVKEFCWTPSWRDNVNLPFSYWVGDTVKDGVSLVFTIGFSRVGIVVTGTLLISIKLILTSHY